MSNGAPVHEIQPCADMTHRSRRIFWPATARLLRADNRHRATVAAMSLVHCGLSADGRHPSNLMLDRLSGKVIHIDFGDCFEVAMTREKFPEKIPFRLTRMLINAMEVGTPPPSPLVQSSLTLAFLLHHHHCLSLHQYRHHHHRFFPGRGVHAICNAFFCVFYHQPFFC